MTGKWKKIAITLIAAAFVLAGCGGGKSDNSGKQAEEEFVVPTDPVTLKFYVNVVRLTDVEYQSIFIDPLKKKYPHITLQKLEGDLGQLVAGGDIPDLIMSDSDWHMPLRELDLPSDLTDLAKKMKIDINKFRPELIQAVRNLNPNGGLEGIPFDMNTGVLFYNKDIFDKFGVPYPKDDMTWYDVLDLSKRLTRQADGIQYIGWDPRFPDHLLSPYSQPFVDPKTNKALIDTPLYRKVLEIFAQVYAQPGYVNGSKYTYGPDGFTTTHIQAMQADWVAKILSDIIGQEAKGNTMNWDMVTDPRFEDTLKKGRHALPEILVIPKGSKHKEQAMQVIEMMTSKEQQIMLTQNGRLTALNDIEVMKQFGAAFPSLKGKNLEAVYKYAPSPSPTPHPADKQVQEVIRAMRKEMAINKKDINTVLREAQEKADKIIAELQAR
jgi:multiple sugar transport system substrate-binding protein